MTSRSLAEASVSLGRGPRRRVAGSGGFHNNGRVSIINVARPDVHGPGEVFRVHQ
jgi:hypothetical protein